MVRSQTQRCSVPNCMFERGGGGGEENGTSMRMAVFPKRHVGLFHKWIVAIRNPQLTGKWLRALQADGPEEARRMMTTIYNTRKICQRHFERKWIRDCSPRTSRPMLYFGAIPTKYLPDTPIPSELMKPDALVKLQNCSSFSNPMKRSRQDFVINKLIDSNTTRVIVQKNHDATIDFERIYIKDQSSSNMKSDHTYTTPDSTSSFSEALHSKAAGVKTIVANGRSVSATGTIIVPLALLGAQHSITTAPEPAGPLAEAIVPELPVPTDSSTAPGEEGLDGNGALGLYLCRVCICAEDNLILLSSVDIDNVSFKDKLKICFPDVEYEDNICNCICKICCDNLKIVYEFRQLYLKNVELLKMWKNGELSIVTGTENANTKIENCVLNPSETIIPDRVVNNTHHVACTTENIATEVITTENITTESVSPSLTTGNEPQMPSEVAESVCDLVKNVSNEEPSAESNLVFFSDDVNEICIQDGLDTSQQVELMSYLNDLNGEEMDESIESYNEECIILPEETATVQEEIVGIETHLLQTSQEFLILEDNAESNTLIPETTEETTTGIESSVIDDLQMNTEPITETVDPGSDRLQVDSKNEPVKNYVEFQKDIQISCSTPLNEEVVEKVVCAEMDEQPMEVILNEAPSDTEKIESLLDGAEKTLESQKTKEEIVEETNEMEVEMSEKTDEEVSKSMPEIGAGTPVLSNVILTPDPIPGAFVDNENESNILKVVDEILESVEIAMKSTDETNQKCSEEEETKNDDASEDRLEKTDELKEPLHHDMINQIISEFTENATENVAEPNTSELEKNQKEEEKVESNDEILQMFMQLQNTSSPKGFDSAPDIAGDSVKIVEVQNSLQSDQINGNPSSSVEFVSNTKQIENPESNVNDTPTAVAEIDELSKLKPLDKIEKYDRIIDEILKDSSVCPSSEIDEKVSVAENRVQENSKIEERTEFGNSSKGSDMLEGLSAPNIEDSNQIDKNKCSTSNPLEVLAYSEENGDTLSNEKVEITHRSNQKYSRIPEQIHIQTDSSILSNEKKTIQRDIILTSPNLSSFTKSDSEVLNDSTKPKVKKIEEYAIEIIKKPESAANMYSILVSNLGINDATTSEAPVTKNITKKRSLTKKMSATENLRLSKVYQRSIVNVHISGTPSNVFVFDEWNRLNPGAKFDRGSPENSPLVKSHESTSYEKTTENKSKSAQAIIDQIVQDFSGDTDSSSSSEDTKCSLMQENTETRSKKLKTNCQYQICCSNIKGKSTDELEEQRTWQYHLRMLLQENLHDIEVRRSGNGTKDSVKCSSSKKLKIVDQIIEDFMDVEDMHLTSDEREKYFIETSPISSVESDAHNETLPMEVDADENNSENIDKKETSTPKRAKNMTNEAGLCKNNIEENSSCSKRLSEEILNVNEDDSKHVKHSNDLMDSDELNKNDEESTSPSYKDSDSKLIKNNSETVNDDGSKDSEIKNDVDLHDLNKDTVNLNSPQARDYASTERFNENANSSNQKPDSSLMTQSNNSNLKHLKDDLQSVNHNLSQTPQPNDSVSDESNVNMETASRHATPSPTQPDDACSKQTNEVEREDTYTHKSPAHITHPSEQNENEIETCAHKSNASQVTNSHNSDTKQSEKDTEIIDSSTSSPLQDLNDNDAQSVNVMEITNDLSSQVTPSDVSSLKQMNIDNKEVVHNCNEGTSLMDVNELNINGKEIANRRNKKLLQTVNEQLNINDKEIANSPDEKFLQTDVNNSDLNGMNSSSVIHCQPKQMNEIMEITDCNESNASTELNDTPPVLLSDSNIETETIRNSTTPLELNSKQLNENNIEHISDSSSSPTAHSTVSCSKQVNDTIIESTNISDSSQIKDDGLILKQSNDNIDCTTNFDSSNSPATHSVIQHVEQVNETVKKSANLSVSSPIKHDHLILKQLNDNVVCTANSDSNLSPSTHSIESCLEQLNETVMENTTSSNSSPIKRDDLILKQLSDNVDCTTNSDSSPSPSTYSIVSCLEQGNETVMENTSIDDTTPIKHDGLLSKQLSDNVDCTTNHDLSPSPTHSLVSCLEQVNETVIENTNVNDLSQIRHDGLISNQLNDNVDCTSNLDSSPSPSTHSDVSCLKQVNETVMETTSISDISPIKDDGLISKQSNDNADCTTNLDSSPSPATRSDVSCLEQQNDTVIEDIIVNDLSQIKHDGLNLKQLNDNVNNVTSLGSSASPSTHSFVSCLEQQNETVIVNNLSQIKHDGLSLKQLNDNVDCTTSLDSSPSPAIHSVIPRLEQVNDSVIENTSDSSSIKHDGLISKQFNDNVDCTANLDSNPSPAKRSNVLCSEQVNEMESISDSSQIKGDDLILKQNENMEIASIHDSSPSQTSHLEDSSSEFEENDMEITNIHGNSSQGTLPDESSPKQLNENIEIISSYDLKEQANENDIGIVKSGELNSSQTVAANNLNLDADDMETVNDNDTYSSQVMHQSAAYSKELSEEHMEVGSNYSSNGSEEEESSQELHEVDTPNSNDSQPKTIIENDQNKLSPNETLRENTSGVFRCPICKRHFANFITFQKHRRLCSRFIYKCEFCEKGFKFRKYFLLHLFKHNINIDDYLLNFANNQSSSKFKRRKKFTCDLCSEEFCYKFSFVRHIQRHENLQATTHTCQICAKTFRSKHKLLSHVQTHTQYLLYQCRICKYRFSNTRDLNVHEYKHKILLINKCCGMFFCNDIGYYRHLKTHCRRGYVRNGALWKTHLRSLKYLCVNNF